jgi:hypothetical protein
MMSLACGRTPSLIGKRARSVSDVFFEVGWDSTRWGPAGVTDLVKIESLTGDFRGYVTPSDPHVWCALAAFSRLLFRERQFRARDDQGV